MVYLKLALAIYLIGSIFVVAFVPWKMVVSDSLFKTIMVNKGMQLFIYLCEILTIAGFLYIIHCLDVIKLIKEVV